MFRLLGSAVTRYWAVMLCGWILVLVVSGLNAPDWNKVTKNGDVDFLSEDMPSRRGDSVFQRAYPDQHASTSVVLVLERSGGRLIDLDEIFIDQTLTPRLERLASMKEGREALVASVVGLAGAGQGQGPLFASANLVPQKNLITRIRTLVERGAGALLISPDKQATVVVVELSAAFLDPTSGPLVEEIEALVDTLGREGKVPQGLTIALTGSATAGRDLLRATVASVRAIEFWTIVAVIVLLVLLYRAPLVALIPLVTVFVAVQISLNLLVMMGAAGILNLSGDVRIFVTVLAYGAGVDYCVFLIARYREELHSGAPPPEAMGNAIALVGGPITASAATVICGIGVLAFMQFGKVREAGLVIPFALSIVLCGTLTFSSTLLRLAGPWAFWPHWGKEPAAGRDVWVTLGPIMLRWPGLIWLGSVGLMLPFAVIAILNYQNLSFNPINDLPAGAPSVRGTQILEKHFSPGILGAVNIFLQNDNVDFSTRKGIELIGKLTDRLEENRRALNLADIRSVATPLGITSAADEANDEGRFGSAAVMRARAVRFYVSRVPKWKGHLTRLDLLLARDPFAPEAIGDLDRLEAAIQDYLPKGLQGTQLYVAGATASIRDLAVVKQRDQQWVEILVPIVIFVLLWLVLHRVVISIYLVLSVLLSYLATMGTAFVVFWWLYPGEFLGLDWKVPIFLFTILVAVGEDYNIFLTMRIKEEQHLHGPLQGITVALARTGRVISSCGFIMAGTFASLLSGSLLAIKELGFALSFGILLDTLVVRPILVPTFLILLEDRFGWLGRYLALGRNVKSG